jgi:hypothetical protein
MWKLILVLVIWLYPISDPSDYIILIADDCMQWRKIDPYRKSDRFSIVKSTRDFHRIMLIHYWIFPEDSLSKINMRYSDILEQNPRYTSELKKEDWFELAYGKDKKKLFLLRPDDFCSGRRFVLNQEFTLYEFSIGLSGDE